MASLPADGRGNKWDVFSLNKDGGAYTILRSLAAAGAKDPAPAPRCCATVTAYYSPPVIPEVLSARAPF